MELRKVLEERIPDEMSMQELLAARIRQLEPKPEDMERAMARTKEARTRNKAHSTKCTGATPTKEDDEADWVPASTISTGPHINSQNDGSGYRW